MRVALSLFYKRFSLLTGGLACLGEGDMVEVDVGAGLMVLGEDALTDFTGLINRALRQQYDNLTKFRIGEFTYYIRS